MRKRDRLSEFNGGAREGVRNALFLVPEGWLGFINIVIELYNGLVFQSWCCLDPQDTRSNCRLRGENHC